MSETNAIPRPFVVLAIAMFVSGMAFFVFSVQRFGFDMSLYLLLIALVALISENTRPIIGRFGLSLGLPMTMAAMLLLGPTAAAFVGGIPALSPSTFRSRRGLATTAYNMGQFVVTSLATGWLYLAMGGRILVSDGVTTPLAPADFPSILVPLAGAAIVCALGNAILASLGVGVLYSLPFRDTFLSAAGYVPSLIALISVGYMIAQVMASSALSLFLFVFPLAVAQSLYQRFKSLKEAYADTVRSFVGALEAKDTYTHGHSERVAEYAMSIGEEMGLDERNLERLEYSALLHDIGKISLSQVLLNKPGSLTDQEMGLMKRHPAEGAEMIGRVPPLAGLAEYVLQHHEHHDGGGYPLGNGGEQVPLLSRILSVADAYDAMTSDRAYRPALPKEEALRRLRECSGTQFDPTIVEVFLAVQADSTAIAAGSTVGVTLSGVDADASTAGV